MIPPPCGRHRPWIRCQVGSWLNDQQDAVAAIVLAELESEDRWDKAFAEGQDLLKELGADAIALDEKGKTSSLDFQQG